MEKQELLEPEVTPQSCSLKNVDGVEGEALSSCYTVAADEAISECSKYDGLNVVKSSAKFLHPSALFSLKEGRR